MDFVPGVDRIASDNSGLASTTDLHFINGTSANGAAATPAILYEKASGKVSWDPDGSGAAAAVMLGKVAAGLYLGLSDFVLI